MKEDIAKRIKIIRKDLNMNKNQFANFLDISPQYLGSVENGDYCLSIEKIILLSQKANVSTDYILLGKTTINKDIIKELGNIDQDQLDSYFNIIKEIIKLSNKKYNV